MMVQKYEHLTSVLKKSCPRVYLEIANSESPFPYVVYNFPTISEIVSDRDDIIVEIDVWDMQKNSYDVVSAIENLTDKIECSLKNYRHIDENHLLIFQKLNRLVIPDTDKSIKRRQLRYLVKSYDKK